MKASLASLPKALACSASDDRPNWHGAIILLKVCTCVPAVSRGEEPSRTSTLASTVSIANEHHWHPLLPQNHPRKPFSAAAGACGYKALERLFNQNLYQPERRFPSLKMAGAVLSGKGIRNGLLAGLIV